jgi:hypothetical protein
VAAARVSPGAARGATRGERVSPALHFSHVSTRKNIGSMHDKYKHVLKTRSTSRIKV